MPTPAIKPDQNHNETLFLGLQSYTEAQSEIFFGRDDEIERLTNLINSNILTIVFGKSGTGKTSLLNAGVFPRLRKNYCLPFRIRLEFNAESPDIITQIKNILKTEIDKYGFKVEKYPTDETLWEYFHREPLWRSITPILIFDQFEEIFTLARKSNRFSGKELSLFWQELADLIENSIPEKLKDTFLNDKEKISYSYKNQNIKILFTFREEYLPEFESVTTKIPSIKYSRFRLMPMNGNQAYDVVTKTWNNKIDAGEAEKIVGFFSDEDEKNISYDLMVIEPSLLSQICAYIDKERIHEGREKISAEFLNKYPKEKILRSIYDEALAESNDAVMQADTSIEKDSKLINEFLEDKLITDEGYRTKYSLGEADEKLKPGIEVLKKKYFIRDDGKSLELTHDVLAPLIKEDREERRKQAALSVARDRARKRSYRIVIGALIFSVLVAGAIWFFTTKKARNDKQVAEKETIVIKQKIAKDSITLDSVKRRINDLVVDKTDTNKIVALQKKNIQLDSTVSGLTKEIQRLNSELSAGNSSVDSVKSINNNLRSNLEALIRLKHEDSIASVNNIAKLTSTYSDLNNKYSALNNDYTNLKNESSSSKNDYTTLKSSYDNLKGDYDLLKRNFNDLKASKATAVSDVKSAEEDNNSLQLNLYSSKNDEIPHNLKIYLIPDIAANKKLIRDSKVYDNHYDFASLNKAQGVKTAVFNNDSYSFPDVDPGDYFIKICYNYGPYKTVTKKAAGNETTSKMDISEIVR
jgi:hypothetical protein